jgi:hypothetical protein
MRFDWLAFCLAVIIEALLTGLAAFGGPHGTLGSVPWMLQLPGILVVFMVPGPLGFVWRVGAMVLIQLTLWYFIIALFRRRKLSKS